VKVLALPVDVTDAPGIEQAFKRVSDENDGKGIDVLVHNAGVAPTGAKIGDIQAEEARKNWWHGYEINVLGTMTVLSAFTRHKTETDSKLVFIGTAASAVFPHGMLGASGYSMSKSAAAVLVQYFAAENLDTKVFTMHPGVVLTEMGARGKKSGNTLPVDDSK
jgi:NAD(P)-dependent dehydrogenase (short-subunit alcohol dehydrogenase family)